MLSFNPPDYHNIDSFLIIIIINYLFFKTIALQLFLISTITSLKLLHL